MLITPIFIIKLLLSNWNILRLIAVQLEETVVIPKGIFTLIKKPPRNWPKNLTTTMG